MRTLIVLASVAAVVAVGCTSARNDQAASTRKIQLAEPVPLDSAVASPVETGRASPAGHASHRMVNASAPTPAPSAARAQRSLDAIAMPAPALAVTSTISEPTMGLVAAPTRAVVEPAAGQLEESVVQRSGTGWHGMGGAVDQMNMPSSGVHRGPTIIIRGGMGGDDDHCDLRPRGFAGSGSSVNRLGPSFAGGMGQGRPAVFQPHR